MAVKKQQGKRNTERKWKANEETASKLKAGRLVITD